jgi:uncharacterized protein (DUF952 family)
MDGSQQNEVKYKISNQTRLFSHCYYVTELTLIHLINYLPAKVNDSKGHAIGKTNSG